MPPKTDLTNRLFAEFPRLVTAVALGLPHGSELDGAPRQLADVGSAEVEQAPSGSISGRIADYQNATMANARVKATNRETGFVAATISDASGTFRLERLPIGIYDIEVAAQAFFAKAEVHVIAGKDAPLEPAKLMFSRAHDEGNEDLLVFVEPAADCELELVKRRAEELAKQKVRLLITGRFTGIALKTGESIGFGASSRFNLPQFSAGTCGAFVENRSSGKWYILSCNHVLAYNGRVPDGADIVSPGTLDGPQARDGSPAQVVGNRDKFFQQLDPVFWPPPAAMPATPGTSLPAQIPFPQNKNGDFALAEVKPGVLPPNLQAIDVAQRPSQARTVRKTGRTTQKTSSEVRFKDFEGYIDLSFGSFYFSDLLGAVGKEKPDGSPFAAPGDSGALVLTDDQPRKALGLVMARAYSTEWGLSVSLVPGHGYYEGYIVLICPMDSMLQQLVNNFNTSQSNIALRCDPEDVKDWTI